MSNSIAFTGNLGKDAELKDVGGSQVLNFSVGNSVGWGDKKETLWMGCAVWGKQAGAVAQYMKKGTKVFITGELSTREYEGKTYLQVRVDHLDFCGSKQDAASAPQQQSQPQGEDMPF